MDGVSNIFTKAAMALSLTRGLGTFTRKYTLFLLPTNHPWMMIDWMEDFCSASG